MKSLLLIVLSMVLLSCATGPVDKTGQAKAKPVVSLSDVDSDVIDDFDRALSFLKEGEFDKAIEILDRIVSSEQRFAAPYVNLGMAHIKKGDNKLGEENLRKALDIDLGHPVANNELGMLYRKAGRFDDAKKAYENALIVHPEYLPARRNLGILCEIYLRDLNCALQQYEKYQENAPDDKDINIWVTDLRNRLGQ